MAIPNSEQVITLALREKECIDMFTPGIFSPNIYPSWANRPPPPSKKEKNIYNLATPVQGGNGKTLFLNEKTRFPA
jgi:hypothetical protein